MKSRWMMAALLVATGCGSAADRDAQEPLTTANGQTNGQTDDDGQTGTSNGQTGNAATNNAATNNAATNNGATNNDATNSGGTTASGVRLTDFHEEIFVGEGCTAGYCHGSFGLGSPDSVINAFVNVEADQPLCGRTHYVVPGDPDASILWVRVRPKTAEDEECGVSKMPAGSETGLDEQSAQMIYEWIQDGAQL